MIKAFRKRQITTEAQMTSNGKRKKHQSLSKCDWGLDIQYLAKEIDILFCLFTPINLAQTWKLGASLDCAVPEDSKTPPECWISSRFGWDIEGQSQKINFKILFDMRLIFVKSLKQT